MEKCYKLHGYPPGFKAKSKEPINSFMASGGSNENLSNVVQSFSDDQCQQLLNTLSRRLVNFPSTNFTGEPSLMNSESGTCHSLTFRMNNIPSSIWIVDSGASRHICNSSQLFTNCKHIDGFTVTLHNNESISVSMTGDVRLDDFLVLKYVLYVPEFDLNIVSVSALTKTKDFTVHFFDDNAIIQDRKKNMKIGKAERHVGLYILQHNNKKNETINLVSLETWHRRFGHPSIDRLVVIKNQLHVKDSFNTLQSPCSVCPLSKQKQLPFPSLNNRCDYLFELIHCDIWGPFNVVDDNGYKYFVTIVDNHNRFV